MSSEVILDQCRLQGEWFIRIGDSPNEAVLRLKKRFGLSEEDEEELTKELGIFLYNELNKNQINNGKN